MKNLLVSMNSKYIHSSLGAWYLKASAEAMGLEVEIMNCTINDSLERVLAGIYTRRPDILAFSCYIWNIGEVLWLCENIKKLLPDTVIILGGPEVSFDSGEVLLKNPSVSYIIRGEGEETFTGLLRALAEGSDINKLEALCYRTAEGVCESSVYAVISDLDSLPSPYTEQMLKENHGKIIYYEASRGCPFSCAYCLSSTFDGVRYFSMDRVEKELEKIVLSGVRQIKFVDRTFNANKKRAMEILRFIGLKFADRQDLNFHFEIAADLFDDRMLEFIRELPAGLVQFEAGVQSTNTDVIKEVQRKTDTPKVLRIISELGRTQKVHIHADLIAGLPKENLISFAKSFEDLYKTKPHQLQLGFLKLLHGCDIRKKYEKYGYIFKSTPPYEVLCNDVLSYDNITELKTVEEMVERLYNSNRYAKSLGYIVNSYGLGAYTFFRDFGKWFENKGLFDRGISAREMYTLLLEFGENMQSIERRLLEELLIYDFLSSENTGNIPATLRYEADKTFRDRCFAFLRDGSNINLYLSHLKDKSAKEIYKNVYFFSFSYDFITTDSFNKQETVVLFDYTRKEKVSGLYKSIKVNLDNGG